MAENNKIEKAVRCFPEEYYADRNNVPPKVHTAPEKMTSIWGHKIRANFEHQAQHEAMRYGTTNAAPAYDPKCYEIRHRWHEQYTKRGQSTFCKSKDGIVGA